MRLRPVCHLVPRPQIQLPQDVLDVHAGRADRDHELLRDLPVAVLTAGQPHDVTLAGSEHPTWPTEFIAGRARRRVECRFDLACEDLE